MIELFNLSDDKIDDVNRIKVKLSCSKIVRSFLIFIFFFFVIIVVMILVVRL